jgi:peptidyl-prolyl cis-trans isomerase D
MFTTIRKHQRWLMTLVAALTIIAFAWLYNTTDLERVGSNIVAKIYGRDVMQVDIEKAVRNYQLALALGQFDLVRDLSGQAQTEDEAANNFIWNLMVLQHEAQRFGVEPGDQAVVDKIKTLPVFQSEGQFDPVKYSEFLQQQLAPRGFSERQLESVIRDTLRLAGVKALVASPAVVMPGEVASALERVRPLDLQVLRWNTSAAAKDVQVTDEELQAAFQARAAQLQVPEKRSVRYVLFALSPDEEKLEA